MVLQENTPSLNESGKARIKVVGVGGGGVNAVRRMSAVDIPGMELLCLNTDASSLTFSYGIPSIVIGAEATKGLGAGGDPAIGRLAAEENRDAIAVELDGADLVFIAAGMGGGTGTGAAPLVAQVATEIGAVSVAVVTTPFKFEGPRRNNSARDGLIPLQAAADTVIVVSNDRLLSNVERTASVRDSFGLADQVMVDAISSLSRIINVAGDVNVDFADIRTVVSGGGLGLMAMGNGEGEGRVIAALKAAFDKPLLTAKPHGAGAMIYFVNGGPDLTMKEIQEAGRFAASVADPNAEIFFGMHMDPKKISDEPVEVILIATHLPESALPDPQHLTVEERVKLATEKYHEAGPEPELPNFLHDLDLRMDPQ